MYTKDANGDGWLVLEQAGSSALADRLPLLANLLSLVVNDRRTVEDKIAFVTEACSRAGDVPYVEGDRMLAGLASPSRLSASSRNPADGPVFMLEFSIDWALLYHQFTIAAAYEAAAQTALAISAYRTEHGHYPASLAVLVTDYIEAIPVDPSNGKPLCYRLDERDGYVLYCVGEDGKDDGGPLRNPKGELYSPSEGPDWVFPGYRDEPDQEWFLVPAKPGLSAGQPANGSASQSTQPGN